jgi:hypothetical protein
MDGAYVIVGEKTMHTKFEPEKLRVRNKNTYVWIILK